MNSEDEQLYLHQSEGSEIYTLTEHCFTSFAANRIASLVYVMLFYSQKVVFKSIFVPKAL
jgi:hypothetical protein